MLVWDENVTVSGSGGYEAYIREPDGTVVSTDAVSSRWYRGESSYVACTETGFYSQDLSFRWDDDLTKFSRVNTERKGAVCFVYFVTSEWNDDETKRYFGATVFETKFAPVLLKIVLKKMEENKTKLLAQNYKENEGLSL
jgi:hypothetical protein